MLYFGGLFLALLTADLGIKQYIEDTFRENEERETIVDGLVFRKVYNRGFMLNKLEDRPEIVKGASAAVGLSILGYDIKLFMEKGRWIRKLGMIFLSAGAASNLGERLIRGKVIDYIGYQGKVRWFSKLTANLADVYLLIGTMLTSVTRR